MKKTIVPISGCSMILGCILAVSTFTKPVVFGTRNIKEIFPFNDHLFTSFWASYYYISSEI
jgi:hypothetical protein